MRKITSQKIELFKSHLKDEEKAAITIEKYIRDISAFTSWSINGKIDKDCVLKYKSYLIEKYALSSVNSAIASLNSFFSFNEWFELRIKTVKTQKAIFAAEERELTKAEYKKLLVAAKEKHNCRLFLLIQTICSTGIRVSELRFITVESLNIGRAEIFAKGKKRTAFLPPELCKILKKYAIDEEIKNGPVFVSKNGNPLNRSNIWNEMKALSKRAGVPQSKVFPHNLRHLFARTYYFHQKDIVRLADILGHANINTTRIYTMETENTLKMQVQSLDLLEKNTT